MKQIIGIGFLLGLLTCCSLASIEDLKELLKQKGTLEGYSGAKIIQYGENEIYSSIDHSYDKVGRYQVLPGMQIGAGGQSSGGVSISTPILVDTVTGKTWTLVISPQRWIELPRFSDKQFYFK